MTASEGRSDPGLGSEAMSRRQLFQLGGTAIGLGALLAACGSSDPPAAGRVGNAPVVTDLEAVVLNNAVYLRTMSSLEYSIVDVYTTLAGIEGLGEGTASALARFTDDHLATGERLAELTADAGGEPYECVNSWLMNRQFQPAVEHVVGREGDGPILDIPPSDDPERDTLTLMNALETLATATYQQMVEKISTPALRAEIVPFGADAARRSATVALIANPPPEGFLSPALSGGEVVPDAAGFMPVYAIPSQFGQLTPIEVQVGARDELGLRFTINFETPADNAYIYEGETCAA